MCKYNVGDIVSIKDNVDYNYSYPGVIKLIEPDSEHPDMLTWIYVVSHEDVLNTHYHPMIGPFWEIREADDPRVELISRATVE